MNLKLSQNYRPLLAFFIIIIFGFTNIGHSLERQCSDDFSMCLDDANQLHTDCTWKNTWARNNALVAYRRCLEMEDQRLKHWQEIAPFLKLPMAFNSNPSSLVEEEVESLGSDEHSSISRAMHLDGRGIEPPKSCKEKYDEKLEELENDQIFCDELFNILIEECLLLISVCPASGGETIPMNATPELSQP